MILDVYRSNVTQTALWLLEYFSVNSLDPENLFSNQDTIMNPSNDCALLPRVHGT